MISRRKRAALRLEDGSEFEGYSFGGAVSSQGEVVFSTGMVGYPQSLTDPSYRGQILVFTYPMIGNYGVPDEVTDIHGIPQYLESSRIQVSGLIVSDADNEKSHHGARKSLPGWLAAQGIPGIQGIDTRALTRRLREHGVMKGRIIVEGVQEEPDTKIEEDNPVASVSCKTVVDYSPAIPSLGIAGFVSSGTKPRIAIVDCGVKANILRILLASGVELVRVPWDYDLKKIKCDGIFLSNGPGDPKACRKTIASVRRALCADVPIFGICLGNQILGLAAGADTYKLPYGHRGQNQPALELGTNRCYMTSQNHGYAIRNDSLPAGWEPWFMNANDDTLEGIRSRDGMHCAVQFHPEGCPGPKDTQFLIDRFVAKAADCRRKRHEVA